VEKNAKEIKDHIEELYWGTGNKVVFVGSFQGRGRCTSSLFHVLA
jgi:hypothetical protein